MGKIFKSMTALSMLGGAAYGGFKLMKHYEYIQEIYNDVILFDKERMLYDDVFEGDSIAVIGGALEMDLSEMTVEEDNVTIDLYCVGSKVKIIVPENMQVVVAGDKVFGAVSINTGVVEEVQEETMTLNINYNIRCSELLVTTELEGLDDIEALDEEMEMEIEDEEIEVEIEDEETEETEEK